MLAEWIDDCQVSEALVGADGFDPVDDWLCAASNVFRVAGDICEPAPKPETAAVDDGTGLAISNGSTALKPHSLSLRTRCRAYASSQCAAAIPPRMSAA